MREEEGFMQGDKWRTEEELAAVNKRSYTHYKKEMQEEQLVKAAFNSPVAPWRALIKSKPLAGVSLDITFSLDREKYEVQLSFTPDLSQREKMKLLKMIQSWARHYENKLRIPADEVLLSELAIEI